VYPVQVTVPYVALVLAVALIVLGGCNRSRAEAPAAPKREGATPAIRAVPIAMFDDLSGLRAFSRIRFPRLCRLLPRRAWLGARSLFP
jgi:hypothetical protein